MKLSRNTLSGLAAVLVASSALVFVEKTGFPRYYSEMSRQESEEFWKSIPFARSILPERARSRARIGIDLASAYLAGLLTYYLLKKK